MRTVVLDLKSNSLGDTISFMPCANFFIEKNDDNVLVKINKNLEKFFKESYPNVKFYSDGDEYDFSLPVEYDFNKPIQTGFAEQLGFHNWEYIRPLMDKPKNSKPINKKYISASIHSTSQLKYWNNPLGKKYQRVSPYWYELFKKIKSSGFSSVVVEKDDLFGKPPHYNGIPSNCIKKTGLPLDESINYIYHSEFFIGLSSGMAWVAHALGKPVVMISNFTEDWNEMDLNIEDYIRITNKNVCHGCWNNPERNKTFDVNDWYWCADHKDTPRQFECHYSITPDYVFDKIKHWLT